MLQIVLGMECNKEEALRAKVIAEKKMESKDFAGARKTAIKAQQLYRELENISQIICVCDVHCSAEDKDEKDWYAILKVEQSADEISIKKQYRKLALLLHPDKNKFPGAESAFKLIGEAQRVLLDKGKRNLYDSRYKRNLQNFGPNKPPQANRTANSVRQSWAPNNMNNASSHVHWPPKPEVFTKFPTFVTTCPLCKRPVPYFKDGNKVLVCQSCKKQFIVADTNAQWVGSNSHQTATYTRVDIPSHGVSHSAANGRYQGNTGSQMAGGNAFAMSGPSKEVGGSKKINEVDMNAGKINRGSSAGTNTEKKDSSKRGKKRAKEDSSESCDTESSIDSEDAEVEKGSDEADVNRRRSSRSKRHVSYNENGSDDDEIPNSDTPLKRESANFTEKTGKGGTGKANGNSVEDNVQRKEETDNDEESDLDSNASPESQGLDVPDPDFSDFDQLRKEDCFKAGQLWAMYDTVDAMPRFYAQIKRVFAFEFKTRIQWLEADPEERNAMLWVEKKLPYSCGKFRKGGTDYANLEMFSHLVREKVPGKSNSIVIYPVKGEIWALFRGWNMDWISNPDVNHKKYEYEFVEVLSDYNENAGIRVAFLVKLKGLTSVFCRKDGVGEVQIPSNELLRFSHSVPSCRMTGGEREDVPAGSFELDPASVPLDLLNK